MTKLDGRTGDHHRHRRPPPTRTLDDYDTVCGRARPSSTTARTTQHARSNQHQTDHPRSSSHSARNSVRRGQVPPRRQSPSSGVGATQTGGHDGARGELVATTTVYVCTSTSAYVIATNTPRDQHHNERRNNTHAPPRRGCRARYNHISR